MAYGNVLCVGSHPVDLDDGRVLGHGDHALSIDIDHPHNAAQIAAGHLRVIDNAPVAMPRNPDGSINAPVTPVKDEVKNNGN